MRPYGVDRRVDCGSVVGRAHTQGRRECGTACMLRSADLCWP